MAPSPQPVEATNHIRNAQAQGAQPDRLERVIAEHRPPTVVSVLAEHTVFENILMMQRRPGIGSPRMMLPSALKDRCRKPTVFLVPLLCYLNK